MITPHPYPAAAVRHALVNSTAVTDLVPAELIKTRPYPPDPLTRPFVSVAVLGLSTQDPHLVRPLVQVTPWVPKLEVLQAHDPDWTSSPDEVAWDIATVIGQVLGRSKNIEFRGAAWSCKWVEGPVMLVDEQRGTDNPLDYAPVRFEMKLRGVRAA